jgi:hypothetical protein
MDEILDCFPSVKFGEPPPGADINTGVRIREKYSSQNTGVRIQNENFIKPFPSSTFVIFVYFVVKNSCQLSGVS